MLRLAVASRAETFERMQEPLAQRGIKAFHLRPKKRAIPVTGPDAAPMREELPDGGADVGFVYPSRLMEGGALDARLELPWVNGREAVLRSRNKAGSLARLDEAGVPVPETTMISNPVRDSTAVEAADRFSYPVVVKPNSTTRGIGVAKAGDPDSLSGVVDYLDLVHDYQATGDKAYLIQEYLPDARDYRAMVVNGTFVGAVERRLPENALAEGRWKHNVHRGAEATGVDLPDRARRLAERAAETLGIEYLGVDLLETGDSFRVNETNARPTIDEETKYEPGFYDTLAQSIRQTASNIRL